MTHPLNADIAASAQWIFEETRLAATRCLARILDRLGLQPEGLCLSGGVTLNCPANTRLAMEGPITPIFAEPNCDDGGLAAGAALYLTHQLLGLERPPLPGTRLPPCGEPGASHPFASLSPASEETILRTLEARERPVRWSRPASAAVAAAKAIAAGKLVGWVQGPSEVGPRALGRRSLLADPRDPDNWARVNRAKSREAWRPFAPAVLESAAGNWFGEMPLPSPYMLFTGQVRSNRLPAITHVDGTSRVQTVADDDVPFADLLRHFEEITGVPVLLNTSLNGPGEPIVEQPEEALSLLSAGAMDVLFIGPFQVETR
jgi:carbamoyltransferase